MNRYFTYFILLGSILTLSYYSMDHALAVMYTSPLEQQNFGLFFLIMSLIVIVIGSFFQWIVPMRSLLIKMDVYGPGLVMLSAAIVGNVFGHNIKTDEFLFYFILTHLATMYAALSTGRQIVSLVKIGALQVNHIAQCAIAVVIGGAIVASVHFFIPEHILINGIWNIYAALILTKLVIDQWKNLYSTRRMTRPA